MDVKLSFGFLYGWQVFHSKLKVMSKKKTVRFVVILILESKLKNTLYFVHLLIIDIKKD